MQELNTFQGKGNQQLTYGEVDENWNAIKQAVDTLEGSVVQYAIEDFDYDYTCGEDYSTNITANFKVRLLADHPAIPLLKVLITVNNKVRKVVQASTSTLVGADYPLLADTLTDTITVPFTLTADDYPASIAVRVYDEKYLTGEPYNFEIEEDLCVYEEPAYTLKFEDTGAKRVTFAMDGEYSVDWGDGTTNEYDGDIADHTYDTTGPYYILITGTPTSIYEIGDSGGRLLAVKGLPVTVHIVEAFFAEGVEGLLDLSNLVNLTTLKIYNWDIPCVLTLPETNLISVIYIESGKHTTATINMILANLAANSVDDGFANLIDQTPPAPPTGQGIVDKGVLEGRGWTVNVDSVGT